MGKILINYRRIGGRNGGNLGPAIKEARWPPKAFFFHGIWCFKGVCLLLQDYLRFRSILPLWLILLLRGKDFCRIRKGNPVGKFSFLRLGEFLCYEEIPFPFLAYFTLPLGLRFMDHYALGSMYLFSSFGLLYLIQSHLLY